MCNLVDSKIHSVLPTVCSLLYLLMLSCAPFGLIFRDGHAFLKSSLRVTNIQGWARIPEIKPSRHALLDFAFLRFYLRNSFYVPVFLKTFFRIPKIKRGPTWRTKRWV